MADDKVEAAPGQPVMSRLDNFLRAPIGADLAVFSDAASTLTAYHAMTVKRISSLARAGLTGDDTIDDSEASSFRVDHPHILELLNRLATVEVSLPLLEVSGIAEPLAKLQYWLEAFPEAVSASQALSLSWRMRLEAYAGASSAPGPITQVQRTTPPAVVKPVTAIASIKRKVRAPVIGGSLRSAIAASLQTLAMERTAEERLEDDEADARAPAQKRPQTQTRRSIATESGVYRCLATGCCFECAKIHEMGPHIRWKHDHTTIWKGNA